MYSRIYKIYIFQLTARGRGGRGGCWEGGADAGRGSSLVVCSSRVYVHQVRWLVGWLFTFHTIPIPFHTIPTPYIHEHHYEHGYEYEYRYVEITCRLLCEGDIGDMSGLGGGSG